uniref:Gypsy retrotransposon integrase-like protein 1 n=1 Tax=Cyprinus carpio carpio TaxID=630221 RepID=A0A9J8A7G0_CYPCA
MRKFYWPRIKRDVVNYIRSCHICQMTGKPNQKVPLAPLQPIAVLATPFEHLTIDCVGPLPRSKTGHAYLLTVMCQSTRYPAAYPLRSITTKSILKALTSFMSVFGIPKTIQSDQGSNFMSRQFSKVMQQLKVKHNISSAYHPQSQGGLERFHQTLKSHLRSYCVELDCDWEDGLPWMLLAIREVVHESTGFSPNELVFGHTVRGPIAVLADEWKTSDPPENVLDYVSSFCYRLYEARAIALRKLGKSQEKMKRLFDRKVQARSFQVDDQVLALLPVLSSPFQARFTGPYTIAKCYLNNNYLLNMPDRRKKVQVCHVNLLKPYMTPVSSLPVNLVTTDIIDLGVPETSVEMADVLEEKNGPSRGVVEGHLNNSEVLADLAYHLSHLCKPEKTDLIKLVNSFPSIFSDVPTQTHVIEHNIDVGMAQPIKQHPYRVNPVKRKLLQKEVDYLLAYNLSEPSFSSWSSPCILVRKPDNSYWFYFFFLHLKNKERQKRRSKQMISKLL